MFYPEKCQSNAFQHVVYQSFLIDMDLSKLLKPGFKEEYLQIKDGFDKYFETWRPERGLHKKYRFKPGVFLKNSPFDLLPQMPEMTIVAREDYVHYPVENIGLKNKVCSFNISPMRGDFSLEKYYNPLELDGKLMLNGYGHLNSAANALFPLQNYMGFKKIYFIGMDMSMLGSLEYSALHTFKSMRHYAKFFNKALPVFNAAYQKAKRAFMRPPYEFESLRAILSYDKIEFINVYEQFKYAAPLEGIRNITYKEFLNE
jgi:hypothetical protein